MPLSTLLQLFDSAPGGFLPAGDYEPGLVLLSVLVAVVSAFMALQLAVRARHAPSRLLRGAALSAGSVTLGAGVWAMHFIGMLAYQLCAEIRYDAWITALSMLPAMAAAWVALTSLARPFSGGWRLLGSGVLMGAGIGLMHYGGMAAVMSRASLRYDPAWFAASIVVAVVLAVLALWVRAGFARQTAVSERWADLLAALTMGAAISGMHYTAMRATRFAGVPDLDPAVSLQQHQGLALAIAVITLAVIALAGSVSAVLRYRLLFQELTRSESRLKTLFQTAVDGVIRLSDDGVIQGLNGAAARIFGGTEQALIGLRLAGLVPHLGSAGTLLLGVSEGMGQTLDGRGLPLRVAIGRSAQAGDGLLVAFITDISERRRIEDALAASEQQHRRLIANLPGVAVNCRHDFRTGRTQLAFVSDAIEALAGWHAAEVLAMDQGLQTLVHPEDRARAGISGRQGQPFVGTYHLEYRLLRRDGETRWVAETGTVAPVGADGWAQVDALVLDVTESRLRNAEFAGVLTAIRRALVVIEFDMAGHIIHVNDKFLALTGYRADELLGEHHRRLCLPGEPATAAYAEHWEALRRGEFRSGEFERMGKDGRHIWIQATYNPILDAAGKPQRIVKFVNDLTERHFMELDLREAKERAEQAAAAKSTFLANMSHEIRTPMNAIIGFTEVVLDGELPATARQHMQTVQRSSRALLGLLNDILDTAKLEHGAMQLEQRPFALRPLCQDVLGTLSLGAERKGLALHLEIASDLPDGLLGDPLRLRQVLMNLAGNAVKFTERGEVRLRAAALPDGRLEIAVQDTGIGIAPDRLAHIFDPFAQADATMTRRFGGTGLGTTIARQLVQLMGGEIGVESRPGEGSRFWVRLPLRPADIDAGPRATAPVLALPPLRLLVVDDVAENLQLLELRLRQLGHHVTTARDGDEALARLQAGGLDLVLMDVQMPGRDGPSACRAWREIEAQRGLPRLPVIALTASAMQDDRQQCLDAGMDGFAVKPVEWPQLQGEIARVLGLSAAPQPAPHDATADVTADRDAAAALARWGDARTLRTQLQRFLAGTLADWPAGREDAAWAHRLRGTLANFGVSEDAALLAALERGEAPAPAEAWRHIQARLQARAAALAGADEDRPDGTAPAPTAPSTSWDPAAASALDQALARGEMPDDLLQRVLRAAPAPVRTRLEQALGDFDLDAARQVLAAQMKDSA